MEYLHHHYDQLTDDERTFVDDMFHNIMQEATSLYDVPLANDDVIERAVDALARAVLESRA